MGRHARAAGESAVIVDTAAIRAALEKLAPGARACFECGDEQPAARIFYQRVNGVANGLWGPRTYRMRRDPGEVVVTRLASTSKPGSAPHGGV